MKKTIKKVEKVLEYKLPIRIKSQNGGYLAYSPVWEDCYAQGDSIEEAVSEINSVTQTLIEIYKEENLRIPLDLDKEGVEVNQVINIPVYVTA